MVLRSVTIWRLLTCLRDKKDACLQIRLLNESDVSLQKLYYDVQMRDIDGNDNYMFVFKNINAVRELEKSKTAQKMNKMAYYQITHEIMTPINSLLSMIQVLKANSSSDKLLNVCYYTTHRMLRTISQYIDLQRLEDGIL